MYEYLSEQFCHDILNLDINRSKSVANLVMALSSSERSTSFVRLSQSPVYQYQFSSLYKAIGDLSLAQDMKKLRSLCLRYSNAQKRIRLQTDVTPIERKYSPSLSERQFVHIPNELIKGNKPVTIGYPLSCIHLSAESNWSLPLSRSRIPIKETANTHGASQLQSLLPQLFEQLGCELIVNTTDSAYTHPSYLAPLYKEAKLVNISRFRHGVKIYTQTKEQNKRGAPKVYGDCYYLRLCDQIAKGKSPTTKEPYEKLQIGIHRLPCSESITLEGSTKKGKPLRIELYRWNDLMIRTKKGYSMKDKPLDLIACKVLDATTNKEVYKKPFFFGLFGKNKQLIDTQEAYEDYRHRYDIEPSFRFNKQQLFLDKYLCERTEHFDQFLLVNQLANWLLYTAADEVAFIPNKWERNKSKPEKPIEKLSIAKTYRSTERLFLTFDLEPFRPKPSKKGKGNIKKKHPKYEVVKKLGNSP